MEQAIIFLADFKLVPNWLEGTTNGPIGSILYNPSWCSPLAPLCLCGCPLQDNS